MSTEITWKNLSKTGFKRLDIKKWQKDNITIEANRGSICERPFICYVNTKDNRYVKAMLPVDTVEQFNRFMELMGMWLRLEEE